MKNNMNTGTKSYVEKVKQYISECNFDFAGIPASGINAPIDEAQLAKMVARIAVSAVTVVTTAMSLRQYLKESSIFTKRIHK